MNEPNDKKNKKKATTDLPAPTPPTEENILSSELAKLSLTHRRFVNMYVTGAYDQDTLATLMDVSKFTIRAWLKRPDVRAAIKAYQDEDTEFLKEGLKSLRFKALQRMNELMDSPIDGVAIQATKDILDRTGFKAIQKKEVDITVKKMEDVVNELMKDSNFIDVDFDEVDDEEE